MKEVEWNSQVFINKIVFTVYLDYIIFRLPVTKQKDRYCERNSETGCSRINKNRYSPNSYREN